MYFKISRVSISLCWILLPYKPLVRRVFSRCHLHFSFIPSSPNFPVPSKFWFMELVLELPLFTVRDNLCWSLWFNYGCNITRMNRNCRKVHQYWDTRQKRFWRFQTLGWTVSHRVGFARVNISVSQQVVLFSLMKILLCLLHASRTERSLHFSWVVALQFFSGLHQLEGVGKRSLQLSVSSWADVNCISSCVLHIEAALYSLDGNCYCFASEKNLFWIALLVSYTSREYVRQLDA